MSFGYSARIPASVVARNVRRGSGVGGAIGAGLEQLGQTGQRVAAQDDQTNEQIAQSETRIEEIEKRRWRATTTATLMTRYADMQLELDEKIEEARKKAPPGAIGHEEAIREVTDEVTGRFLSEIPDDDELQNRFRPLVANQSARATLAERGWEQQTRSEHIANSYDNWRTQATSRLYSDPTGTGFASMIEEGEAAIELLDLDETTKAAMRTDLREAATRSMLTGLLDTGRTDVVRTAIKAGDFDTVLDDQGKSAYLAKADTADRVAANEADAAAAEARRVALDRAKQIQVMIENGEDVSASDAEDAIAAMTAAGVDKSEIMEFGYLAEDATVSQSLRKYSTPQLQAGRAKLQAKLDAGEGTAQDERALGIFDNHLKARTTEEADTLSKLWKGGVEQRLQALQQARALPAGLRTNAAAQVSTQMQLLLDMPVRWQTHALQGADIRADRKDDFYPEPTVDHAKGKDVADAVLRDFLGDTINDIGGVSGDLRETALDMMAGSRASNGRAEGWHEGDFRAALRALTGGRQREDGTWEGGVGTVEGFKVELPPGVSQEEFARPYARQNFPGARYADGTEAKPGDVRKHFRPVYLETTEDGATVYVMQGPSGLLLSEDGPFKLKVWGANDAD